LGDTHACTDTSGSMSFCTRGVHSVREFVPTAADTESSMQARFQVAMTTQITNKNVNSARTSWNWPSTNGGWWSASRNVKFCATFGTVPSTTAWNPATGKYGIGTFPGYTSAVTSCTEHSPLIISPIDFTSSITVTGQAQTVYPCKEETITIALTPTVDVFKKCATEDVKITLSGLTGFQPALDGSGAIKNMMDITWDTVAKTDLAFTETTGTLEVVVKDILTASNVNLVGGTTYSLDFTRKVLQDKGDTSMSIYVQTASSMCNTRYVGFIYVECFKWTARKMGQSSYYPCDSNTITVTLTPNIGILGTCNGYSGTSFAAANAGYPKITLTGFDSDGTTATRKSVFSDADGDLTLTAAVGGDTTGAWVGSTGAVTIVPTTDMAKDGAVIFSFTAKNSPRFNDDAPDVRVKVDRYNTVCCTGGSITDGCGLGSVWLLNPDFATFSSVQQSSPYPCATNTITVDLWSNVPFITTECAPKITVAGLTGTCTADKSDLTIVPTSSGTAVVGAWTRNTGTLVVSVAGDDTVDTNGVTAASSASSSASGLSQTPGVRTTWADEPGWAVTTDAANAVPHSGTAFSYFQRKFSFDVKNPSAGPSGISAEAYAPAVSVRASFVKTDLNTDWLDRTATDPYSGLLTSSTTTTVFTKSIKAYGYFNNTYAGTPGYNYRNLASYTAGSPEAYAAYVSASKPTHWEKYPLYMMPLRFEAFVAQSSPFPCDSNTLTLFVQTNVPLIKSCAPKLTLSGITGAETPANVAADAAANGFEVQLHTTPGYSTTSAVWEGDKTGTKTGADEGVKWTRQNNNSPFASSLELDVSLWLTDTERETLGTTTDDDPTVDQLYITFDVNNVNKHHSCATPTVTMNFVGTCTGDVITQSQSASSVTSEDVSSLHLPSTTAVGMYYSPAHSDVSAWPSDVSVFGGFDSSVYTETDVPSSVNGNWAKAQRGEARPMCIRAPEFKCIPAHQTSYYPCDSNTVTVTLHSFVPLFAKCNGKTQTEIDISGLEIFQTVADLQALAVAVTDESGSPSLVATAAWNTETSIKVKLVADKIMKADSHYVITATRFNDQNRASVLTEPNIGVHALDVVHTEQQTQPTSRSADPTSLPAEPPSYLYSNYQTDAVASSTAPYSRITGPSSVNMYRGRNYRLNACFDYLNTVKPGCMAHSIQQSSTYPCASNTITVYLRPDVPLLSTCGDTVATQARPTLTITGFDNDQTYTRTLATSIWAVSTNGATYSSMFTDATIADMATPMSFANTAGTGATTPTTLSGGSPVTLASTAAYSEDKGEVTITVTADWTAATHVDIATPDYLVYSFTAKNSPKYGNDATSVQVKMSGLENPSSCLLGSVMIMDPYFATFSSIRQSSPYPCADNSITIDLWSSVPFLADCVSKVTISGLGKVTCTTSASVTDATDVSDGTDSGTGIERTSPAPVFEANGDLVVQIAAAATADADALRVSSPVDGASPGVDKGIAGLFYSSATSSSTRTLPNALRAGVVDTLADAPGIKYETVVGQGTRSIKYYRRKFTLTLKNAAAERDAQQVSVKAPLTWPRIRPFRAQDPSIGARCRPTVIMLVRATTTRTM